MQIKYMINFHFQKIYIMKLRISYFYHHFLLFQFKGEEKIIVIYFVFRTISFRLHQCNLEIVHSRFSLCLSIYYNLLIMELFVHSDTACIILNLYNNLLFCMLLLK